MSKRLIRATRPKLRLQKGRQYAVLVIRLPIVAAKDTTTCAAAMDEEYIGSAIDAIINYAAGAVQQHGGGILKVNKKEASHRYL